MARAIINTPVEGFTGTVAGVTFANGTGETDDENAIAYFERQGYDVILAPKDATPSTPTKSWKVEDIEKWAAEQEPAIDLSTAAKKDEKLALIASTLKERAAAASATGAPASE